MAIITPRAAAFQVAVLARFPGATPAGIYSCRHIIPHDGGSSGTWSEHAWGNAVDVRASSAVMSKIVAWAEAHRSVFGINNVIGPGSAVAVVHVDFLPSHAGQVPACAGGPAVTSPGSTTTTGPKNMKGACPPGKLPINVGGTVTCVDPFPNGPGGVQIPGAGIIGDIGAFLGKLPRYLEVGGGAFVMIAGLGVLLVGATGQQNKAAQVALSLTPGARALSAANAPAGTTSRELARDKASYEGYWSRRENNSGPSIKGIG